MSLRIIGPGMVLIIIATVSALFGFGVVSDDAPLAAQLCAVFFLLAAVAAFGWGWMNRSRPSDRDTRSRRGEVPKKPVDSDTSEREWRSGYATTNCPAAQF